MATTTPAPFTAARKSYVDYAGEPVCPVCNSEYPTCSCLYTGEHADGEEHYAYTYSNEVCSLCDYLVYDRPRVSGETVAQFEQAALQLYAGDKSSARSVLGSVLTRLKELQDHAHKRCVQCGQEKPLDQFSQDARQYDGLRLVCKECDASNSRERRRRNAI